MPDTCPRLCLRVYLIIDLQLLERSVVMGSEFWWLLPLLCCGSDPCSLRMLWRLQRCCSSSDSCVWGLHAFISRVTLAVLVPLTGSEEWASSHLKRFLGRVFVERQWMWLVDKAVQDVGIAGGSGCCSHTDIPAWFAVLCHLQSWYQGCVSSVWQHKTKAGLKQKILRLCFVWKSTLQSGFSIGMAWNAEDCKHCKESQKFISAFQLWGLEWCLVTLLPAGPGAFSLMQTWQKYWQFINCHLFLSSQSRQLIFTTDVNNWWDCRQVLCAHCIWIERGKIYGDPYSYGEGINDTQINCYPTAFCYSQPQLENFSCSSCLTTWAPSAWNGRARALQEEP